MSMIEYIEPFSAGEMFAGIGALILMCVFSWILYRIYLKVIQWWDVNINIDMKYNMIEEIKLNELAREKGYNLDEELIKKDIIKMKRKSFRRRIEDQIIEEWFGKEDDSSKSDKGGK